MEFMTSALAGFGVGTITMIGLAMIANKFTKSEEEKLLDSVLANNQKLLDLAEFLQEQTEDQVDRIAALELEIEELTAERNDLEGDLAETKQALAKLEQENDILVNGDDSTELVPFPTVVNNVVTVPLSAAPLGATA